MKLKELHLLTTFFADFETTESLTEALPDLLRSLTHAEAGLFYLFTSGRFRAVHQWGFSQAIAPADALSADQHLWEELSTPAQVESREVLKSVQMQTGFLIPLRIQKEITGMMIIFKSKETFEKEVSDLLPLFAHITALHLQRVYKQESFNRLPQYPSPAASILPTPHRLIRQIIDSDPNPIFVKDQQGNFVFVNRALAALFDASPEEIVNRNQADLHPHEEEVDYYQQIEKQVVAEMKQVVVEEVFTDQQGNVRHYQSIKKPLVTDDGTVYVLGIATEITERKQFEQELLQAKMLAEESLSIKEEFVSTISHEIRTPLNSVIAATHLLLRESPHPKQMELLKTLYSSANMLLLLLNDVLDFSKMQAGRIEFENIDFNLREVIRGIKHTYKVRASDKNISFNTSVEEAVPEFICGDALRLNQILTNLVSNAIKFTHKGGVRVEVSLRERKADQVVLEFEVRDSGIGIAPDKQAAVFERFSQAGSDIPRKYGGTGLGLAIVKKLVETQAGSISLESRENQGSVFRFFIPFRKASVSFDSATAPLRRESFDDLPGMRILLVEDTPTNQLLTSRFLEDWKIETEVATNGLEALKKLREKNYDLVLMDLQMPVMDGFEATREIRSAGHPGYLLPIIALTADDSEKIRRQVLETGMNDLVSKPINPALLHEKIRIFAPQPLPGDTQLHEAVPVPPAVERGMADYSFLQEAAAGNEHFIKMMLRLTLKELEEFEEVFGKAIEQGNLVEVNRLTHKILPHLESYKLDEARFFIRKLADLIEQGEDAGKISTYRQRLMSYLGAIREEFRQKVNG